MPDSRRVAETPDGTSAYLQVTADGDLRVTEDGGPAAAIAEGRFFLFSSTRSVPSGSEATWSIANPDDSGKVLKIVYVSAHTDSTSQVLFEVYKDSTITGGTALAPWDPNFSTAGTSAAAVEDAQDGRTGGEQLEAEIPVVRDEPFRFEGLLVVPPGTSLQLTGVVPGSLSSQQLTAGARWYEEPV